MKSIIDTTTVRPINISDKKAYLKIITDSISDDGTAFYSSSTDRVIDDHLMSRVMETLNDNNFRLGAFQGERLVGLIAFKRNPQRKLSHKGVIFSFYVYPSFRCKGIGRALLEATITKAQQIEGLEKINLTVMEPSTKAMSLYRKFGFSNYGVEHRSMKVNGRYVSEIFMELEL